MIDFLKYFVRVKHESYYNNLSIHHLVVILLFFLGVVLILILAKKDNHLTRIKQVDKFLTVLLIGTQLIYYSWYFFTNGDYDPYPLYTCRIAAIFLCFTAFWKVKALEDFGILAGVYGSLCAIILSSPSPFAFPHIMRLSYFMLHFCLGYLALTRIIIRKSDFNNHVLINACILNALALSGIYMINRVWHWNYSFLVYPPLFYNTYLKMNPTLYTLGAFITYFVLLFVGYLLSKLIIQKL